MAIVNYNLREESKDEISYAKELALKYNKQIFIKDIFLQSTSNFEKNARDIRYDFFNEIIKKHNYETLITAHQLNDKLEWFMMQLSKGAGLVELIGLNKWENKSNYKIFKPLLDISKDELKAYLEENNRHFFIDKSNFNEKYKRNYFRHNFSDRFLNEFKNGVKNSFNYLQDDLNSLDISQNCIYKEKELEVFENRNDDNINIRTIDLSLKKRGIVLSSKTRKEILKNKEVVVSHKFSISINKKYIYICPYENLNMDKKFKEKCRVMNIPKNIRAYLYKENIDLKSLVV